jgi:hypothetical protein
MEIKNLSKEFFMKRGLLLLVLTLGIAGGVFAQAKTANAKSNWISGEVSLFGIGARYERMLTDKISLGASAYFNSFFFIWNDAGIDASFRFYPSGKVFFFGGELGFHWQQTFNLVNLFGSRTVSQLLGFAITPEVGWKIDVGSAGGFFMQPGVKVPIVFGWNTSYNNRFGVGWALIAYFGMGFAF